MSENETRGRGEGAGRLDIFMVRHAHADWIPDESRPLSAQGESDATRVALLLAPLPLDAIYSSPYPRALETVEPLATLVGLEIQVIEGLRERTLAAGAVDDFPAAMRASWEDLEHSFAGGESSSAALARFSLAVDDIVARHGRGAVALATHGNVLGLWLQQCDPAYDYDFWCSMSWPDIYRVSLDWGRMVGVDRLWGEIAR